MLAQTATAAFPSPGDERAADTTAPSFLCLSQE